MSLMTIFKSRGKSGFGYSNTALHVTEGINLSGKTFLLTGCNSGLGMETLRVLSLRGAHIIALARTLAKAQTAIQNTGGKGTPLACNLSEPSSVFSCVESVRLLDKKLDGIICNAGIMALPKLQVKYDLELQFLTNHVGHFMLVTELLSQLSENGRVVVLSSSAHRMTVKGGIQFDNLNGSKGYSAMRNYGQSKLANLLFIKQLAKRLPCAGQTANAIHPGVISTNLGRHMNLLIGGLMTIMVPLFMKTIPQGAATQCFVAAHPSLSAVSGKYFSDCNQSSISAHGDNPDLAQRLWQETELLVKSFKHDEIMN